MKNNQVNQAMQIFGNIVRKVAESAVHAAVFAFVSKKVSNMMSKHEDKSKEDDKLRVENNNSPESV